MLLSRRRRRRRQARHPRQVRTLPSLRLVLRRPSHPHLLLTLLSLLRMHIVFCNVEVCSFVIPPLTSLIIDRSLSVFSERR